MLLCEYNVFFCLEEWRSGPSGRGTVAPFILKAYASFLQFGSGAFCIRGWSLGGFPFLSGRCAARSADEGVVDELAEYGVESVGGRAQRHQPGSTGHSCRG